MPPTDPEMIQRVHEAISELREAVLEAEGQGLTVKVRDETKYELVVRTIEARIARIHVLTPTSP